MVFIEKLQIENFKSIKKLILKCKPINIFIGKPNTGKSNILEALGLLSSMSSPLPLKNFIRYNSEIELFFDYNYSLPISFDIKFNIQNDENSRYQIEFVLKSTKVFQDKLIPNNLFQWPLSQKNNSLFEKTVLSIIKYYKFSEENKNIPLEFYDYLLTPSGNNLFYLILANKKIQETIVQILDEYNLKLILDHSQKRINFQKQQELIGNAFPYENLSDTLRRYIFHLIAIETNSNCVLIFEEPEVHSYPFYITQLAETIAQYPNHNQFFISTHNTEFIGMILDKTPLENLNLFYTYIANGATQVKLLNEKHINQFIEQQGDFFLNVENILDLLS